MKAKNYNSPEMDEIEKGLITDLLDKIKVFKITVSSLLIIMALQSIIIGIIIYKHKQQIKSMQTITSIIIDYSDLDAVISHLKEYEDFSSTPYQLPNDTNWYIGYGYQIKEGFLFSNVTKQQGTGLLMEVLTEKLDFVKRTYEFNGSKALAVAVLCYRWGEGNLIDSKLHKALLEDDFIEIVLQWSNINKYNGKDHKLVNERAVFELQMFFKK
jgi:GH24 family phage-related lysozyme (muramidase)